MPRILRRTAVALVAAVCLCSVAVSSASAGILLPDGESCPTLSQEQVFSRWLDPLQYGLVPGGDFESLSDGWSLNGASRVTGNDPFWLANGHTSLRVPAGASVTSPTVCVGLLDATLRYVLRSPGSLLASLRVEVLFEDSAGNVLSAPIGLEPGLLPGWRPSLPTLVVANLLSLAPNAQAPVRFRFTASGGTFQLDDVFVDPYMKR